MANGNPAIPWRDGTYRCKSMPPYLFVVEGETVVLKGFGILETDENTKGTWKYGEIGEAKEAIAQATGKKFYDVDIQLYMGWFDAKGVVSEDGKKITFWSALGNQLDTYELMSEEELRDFYNDCDPYDAPPNQYKVQPENQGKFLFLTGAPGLGKSTSALLLGQMAGYVYYEGDCILQGNNPYVPLDAKEPTLAAMQQRRLKGIPKETEHVIAEGGVHFMEWVEEREYDKEKLEGLFRELCADICKERKRLGGDWAIAFAVPTRHYRDLMKKILGPDVIFVVLNMSKEGQEERIRQRHGEDAGATGESLMKMNAFYEPATEDEDQAIDVLVTNDMSREDVVKKILSMI